MNIVFELLNIHLLFVLCLYKILHIGHDHRQKIKQIQNLQHEIIEYQKQQLTFIHGRKVRIKEKIIV